MDPLLNLLFNKQILFEVDSFLLSLLMLITLVLRGILGTLFGSLLGLISRSLTALRNQKTLCFGGTPAACFGGLLLSTGLILGVLPEFIALLLLSLDVKHMCILSIILLLLPGFRRSSSDL